LNSACPNQGPIPVEVYDNLYKQFNPTKFDAKGWVGLAQSAGMKYMVLTAKHCDGFLLWHSKISDYNMAATPFRRDICAELAAAAHKQDMRLGWYFSPMDWRDPDFRSERNAAFVKRMQSEIKELLSNYGPIDLFWFDWDAREPRYDQPRTYALARQLQPTILLTNRLDLGPGNNDRQILSSHADYYTPEQSIGNYDDQQPWETCMTLGTQWAWKPDDQIKSLKQCVDILVRCAGGDGNLLLNVGPMPSGEIEPRQVEVLKQMGQWLAKHGASIYGTRGGPWKPDKWGAATHKGNTAFIHILDPKLDTVTLPAMKKRIVGSSVLTGGTATVKQTDQAIEIVVPKADRREIDTIVVLTLEG
jgi:alpha-L-fucosidase